MRGGDRKWRRGRGRSHQLSAHPIHDTIVAELLHPCPNKKPGVNVAGARCLGQLAGGGGVVLGPFCGILLRESPLDIFSRLWENGRRWFRH